MCPGSCNPDCKSFPNLEGCEVQPIEPTPTPTPTPIAQPPIINNQAIAISIVINQIKNIFKSHTTVNNIVPTPVPQTFFAKNQTVPLHLCNGVAPGPCYDILHKQS